MMIDLQRMWIGLVGIDKAMEAECQVVYDADGVMVGNQFGYVILLPKGDIAISGDPLPGCEADIEKDAALSVAFDEVFQ